MLISLFNFKSNSNLSVVKMVKGYRYCCNYKVEASFNEIIIIILINVYELALEYLNRVGDYDKRDKILEIYSKLSYNSMEEYDLEECLKYILKNPIYLSKFKLFFNEKNSNLEELRNFLNSFLLNFIQIDMEIMNEVTAEIISKIVKKSFSPEEILNNSTRVEMIDSETKMYDTALNLSTIRVPLEDKLFSRKLSIRSLSKPFVQNICKDFSIDRIYETIIGHKDQKFGLVFLTKLIYFIETQFNQHSSKEMSKEFERFFIEVKDFIILSSIKAKINLTAQKSIKTIFQYIQLLRLTLSQFYLVGAFSFILVNTNVRENENLIIHSNRGITYISREEFFRQIFNFPVILAMKFAVESKSSKYYLRFFIKFTEILNSLDQEEI